MKVIHECSCSNDRRVKRYILSPLSKLSKDGLYFRGKRENVESSVSLNFGTKGFTFLSEYGPSELQVNNQIFPKAHTVV